MMFGSGFLSVVEIVNYDKFSTVVSAVLISEQTEKENQRKAARGSPRKPIW